MVGGETTSSTGQGVASRRDTAVGALRTGLGIAAILVIVLAGLALLNSLEIERAPGDPDVEPGGSEGNEGDASGDMGEGPKCETIERTFFWMFAAFAGAGLALFVIAVARREHHGGRIGSSVWGILSVVATFLAVMSFGGWRIMRALCDAALTCEDANDGTYSSFIFLLVLTLAALFLGLVLAHRGRRNFLTTGWGLLGLLMYLPTILTGFAWFLIRTLCTPELSCATRDQFLDDLAMIFWLALLGTVLVTAAGIFVQRRFQHGFFRSGWGVLAILLGLLAVFSGFGWLFVDNLTIPGCDPLPEQEEQEEPEPRTCEEIRDDLRSRIVRGMIALLIIGAALTAIGIARHREDLRGFWGSPWAILLYIVLALVVLLGLGYLLAGTMCDEDEPRRGDGDEGEGSGGSGDGGGQGGDRGGGSDRGGSGPGSGPGGGGGGPGGSPQVPTVPIDPRSLMWVLIAILVVVAAAALIVLLRARRGGIDAGDALVQPEPDAVQAAERRDLMTLLSRGELASAEAVIAAYRAFVAWATARGHALGRTETPREHARRVQAAYKIPEDAMDRFIRAYEIARLSQHEPTADERAQAVRFAQELGRPAAPAPPGGGEP